MKMFKFTALSFALSVASLSAMAAETAQITVKGAVFPSACSISVAGAVDFGNLKKSDIKQSNELNGYQLGYKPVSFNIQCSSAAKVALSAQADTPVSGSDILGVVSHISETESTIRSQHGQLASLGQLDGHDIGYYSMALVSATLDSQNAELLFSENNGSSWNKVSGVNDHLMFQDGSVFHGWGKDITPQEATNITGVINISAALDVKIVDEMKDAINFNSNTTLSLQYL